MPLPIQNDRVTRLIHSAYNIVGRFRARIDETVVPVCIVDDFATGSSFPEVRRASAQFRQAAVALEHAVWRLETPPNVLAVIRLMDFLPDATGQVQIFFGSSFPAPGSFADKVFIDGRIRNRGETPAANLTFGTQVAGLATAHFALRPSATPVYMPFPMGVNWPIGQVNAFDFVEFSFITVNVGVRMSIVWDEYLIQP